MKKQYDKVSELSARQIFCASCKKLHAHKKYGIVKLPFVCPACKEFHGITEEDEAKRLLEKWGPVLNGPSKNVTAMLIESQQRFSPDIFKDLMDQKHDGCKPPPVIGTCPSCVKTQTPCGCE